MADFLSLIQTLQKSNQAFANNKKRPPAQRLKIIENFSALLVKKKELLKSESSLPEPYFESDWSEALKELGNMQTAPPHTSLPLGPCLVFLHWSSPLSRFVGTVLCAFLSGNSIVTHSFKKNKTYDLLFEIFNEACGDLETLQSVTTHQKELLEPLYSHPILRAVHMSAPADEVFFLKPYLQQERKIYKLNFGSRNASIFLYDTDRSDLSVWLKQSLNFYQWSEWRCHRWFVQEKIYEEFCKQISHLLTTTPMDFSFPDTEFLSQYQTQWASLQKDGKNWQSVPATTVNGVFVCYNIDFNNCSPWQQQALSGPALTITRFKNSNEAIKFANTTFYSDTACVFTASEEKFKDISQQLMMPQTSWNQIYNFNAYKKHITLYETGNHCPLSDSDFFNLKG